MKFDAETLFEIGMDEYSKAGISLDINAKDAVGQWAYYSADEEYASEEDVREELRGYIAAEKANM